MYYQTKTPIIQLLKTLLVELTKLTTSSALTKDHIKKIVRKKKKKTYITSSQKKNQPLMSITI